MPDIFKSRTFWVIVITFIINGITGIRESIPPNALVIIDAILGILATYFHITPRVAFGRFKKLEAQAKGLTN